ncbi:FMN-dependent NADH-azoreductase [Agrobacterium larrymoorei]|uniref:FMN-dependent NADH-azoreductase n=1 Tax=Agrobacterium larrymoorei TaxID=160699 RepID=UPI001571F4FF|nr:NAD(P)H-dependent oxidoreductase [Agrobacterium larrymoorei]NTJ44787.1 FMN-dependent NADH-azoreductase [Agrobacterium larrymoorei]
MKLLHIDSSISGEKSVSRLLSHAVVDHFKKLNPGLIVTYRDVVANPLDHLANEPGSEDSDRLIYLHRRRDEALSRQVLEEFLDANIIVIGVGLYNLSVASQLKAWIDRIVIPEQTFKFSAEGADGLCSDKRVILAVARGQYYRQSVFLAPTEHAEAYLRSIFAFLDIEEVDVVVAEGLATGTMRKLDIINDALRNIRQLSYGDKVLNNGDLK